MTSIKLDMGKLGDELKRLGDVKDCRAVVGYETPYCVPVHERLDVNHPHGQAKFLEEPLRVNERQLAEMLYRHMKAGNSFPKALVATLILLKTLSQEVVPVDTGRLRDSAFVKLENG